MMKNILIVVAVMGVLGIAGGVLVLGNDKNKSSLTNETQPTFSDSESVNPASPNSFVNTSEIESAPKYLPYTSAALELSYNTRRVLFFYANWCPTCKPADQNFLKNSSQLPNDVTLIRVNYNDNETEAEEKELAKKYGVTYQHTFVQIDAQGNEVAKWNGGDIDELLANLK